MENSTQKALLALGFIGTLFSGLIAAKESKKDAASLRPEYTQIDQSTCQFKSFGKPMMIHYNPAINELDVIVFGCLDSETNEIRQASKSKDLENLIPIRFTAKNVDTNVQIDRIYNGWRETYVGKFLEGTLQNLTLLPVRKHPGNPFIEIMLKEKTPSKIVLEDTEALGYLVKHLQKAITKEGIEASETKPLMLIVFKKTNQIISDEDLNFLATYWEIVDQKDQNALKFFGNTQREINTAREDTTSAKNILDSNGEAFMRLLEKETYDFKGKDLALQIGFTMLTWATIELVKPKAKEFIQKYVWGKVSGSPAPTLNPLAPAIAALTEATNALTAATAAHAH